MLEPLSTSYEKFKKKIENRKSQLSNGTENSNKNESDSENPVFAYKDPKDKQYKSPTLSARKVNYLDSINKRYKTSDKRERGSEKREKKEETGFNSSPKSPGLQ